MLLGEYKYNIFLLEHLFVMIFLLMLPGFLTGFAYFNLGLFFST